MFEEQIQVLLVDDDKSFRGPLTQYLKTHYGFYVDPFVNGNDALQAILESDTPYDVAVLDESLENGPSGTEMVTEIRNLGSDIEIIIFTGWGTDSKQEALQAGAFGYLEKPFNNDELAMLIRSAAQQVQLRRRGQSFLSKLNLSRVLGDIATAAQSLTTAKEVCIVLQDRWTEHLDLYPPLLNDSAWTRHFNNNNLTREIIKSRRMVRIPDTHSDGRVTEEVIDSGIQSFIGMPIPGPRDSLGVLYVYSDKTDHFETGTTISVLQNLARQAGLAIANARAFEELTAIHELSAMISSSLEPDKVLQATCQTLVEFFGVDHSGMVRFDPDYSQGRVVAEYPVAVGTLGTIIPVGNVPDEERLVSTNKPLIISDLASQETLGPVRDLFLKHNIHSTLIVPVIFNEHLLGSFSLDMINRRREFSQGEIEQCKLFASQVAVAIANADVFAQTQQYADQLEQVRETALAVTSQTELAPLLEEIMERAVTLLEARSGGVYAYDEDRGELTVIADYSEDRGVVGQILRVGEGMAGRLVQSRKPYMILEDYDSWEAKAINYKDDRPFGAVIEVQLNWQDKIVGILFVDDFSGRIFTVDDANLLQLIADHVAIALVNAERLRQSHIGREKLRKSFEASIMLRVAREPDLVLEDLIGQICEVADAAWVSISLINDQGHARHLHNEGDGDMGDVASIFRKDGISMNVFKTGVPAIIEDTEKQRNKVNPVMFEHRVGAALCLPFTIYGEHLGVVWIHFDKPRRFEKYDIDALQLCTNQAATAYESARKIESLEHMDEAAELLSAADSLESVLEQIVSSSIKVFQAVAAAIWSYDEARDKFIVSESIGNGMAPEVWESLRKIDLHTCELASRVMAAGWIGIEDIYDKQIDFPDKEARGSLEDLGARSLQAVALSVGGEKLGLVFVLFDQPRRFDDEDRRKTQTFANHASLALKKARLFRSVQKMRDAARIVAQMTVLQDLKGTLKSVVREIKDVLDGDAIVLYAYDEESDRLEYPPTMIGVRNLDGVQQLTIVERSSVVFEMLDQPEPYIVQDTSEDPKFLETRFTQEEEIASLIAIPLRFGDSRVGVIFVNFRQPRDFTEDELKNIQPFADLAAVAIHDTQLYEKEQKRAGMFKALIEAGRAITSSLDLNETLSRIAKHAWFLAGGTNEAALFSDIVLVHANQAEFVSAYTPEELLQTINSIGKRIDWRKGIDGRSGIIGRAISTGHTQRIGDTLKDDDFLKSHPETRSEMAVPIKSNQQVIGVINVEHAHYDAFNELQERALEALAGQAAVAIENARYAEALHTLQETSTAVNTVLDVDKSLELITVQAANVFNAPAVSVMLWDDKRENLVIRAALGLGKDYITSQRVPRKIVEKNTKDGNYSVRIFPIHSQALGNTELVLREGLFSVLVATLLDSDGKLIGILNIYSKSKEHQFREQDKELATILANHASGVIQNARQYQREINRLRETETLQGIAASLAGTLELHNLLSQVMREAKELTGTQRGSFLFWDAQSKLFSEALSTTGQDGSLEKYATTARGDGMAARIVKTRIPVVIHDTYRETDINPVAIEKNRRALIGMPLVCGDEAIGVLFVNSDQPRSFSLRQIALLQSLADFAAVAIERARRYEELKKTRGLVGTVTAVAWMGTVAGAWRHAVGNHATTIADLAELIRIDLQNKRSAAKIEERLVEIGDAVNDIQSIPMPPLSDEDGVISVNLDELIEDRIAQFRRKAGRFKGTTYKLKITLDKAATVRSSPEWLRRVIDILVNNAVNAMHDTPRKQIAIAIYAANGGAEIVVSDTGNGIAEDVQEILFKKPIEKPKGVEGSGLGLFLARTIVETYGGSLNILSTNSAGTDMVIWLPLEG